MTTTDPPTQTPPTQSPPTGPTTAPRRLRRSRDQRMIAGVCGGLGRYTGVDPVVFRVVLAVLLLFGGAGAALYLAGWLFLPEDGDTASPVEALLGRGHSSTSAFTTIVLGVIGVVALGFALHGEQAVLLGVAIVAVVLLVRRQQPSGTAPTVPAPAPPEAFAPHGPYSGYVPAPATPRAPKERSRLFRLVLSTALVILGILVAVDQMHGVRISPATYAASALAVVGAGLVVGARYGRARPLIGLGVVLCLVLAAASAEPHSRHGTTVSHQIWAPQTATAINSSYDQGAGEVTLDLTAVNFADASAKTTVHLGIGHLRVLLPKNVDATVHAGMRAGNVDLFGERAGGTGLHRTVTNLGADGAGGGHLDLFLNDGIGTLEVSRD